jgi:hypothetical protein
VFEVVGAVLEMDVVIEVIQKGADVVVGVEPVGFIRDRFQVLRHKFQREPEHLRPLA